MAYRILSIDGGGVRGLIPALVLAEMERRSGRPTAELFDLVAGTSTGALVALRLARADRGGGPRWAADDVATAFRHGSRTVFGRTPAQVLRTADGLVGPKYDPAAL